MIGALPHAAVSAELRVFAAASLAEALTEIGKIYEAAHGDRVQLNLGASSQLARQIKEGAPADVFFSADEAKMDDLANAGLLAPDTRRTLLGNTLVIVVNATDAPALAAPADLAGNAVRRIALAEPRTVPAGIYAKEFLTRAKLWDRVLPKVVPTENVRAPLAAVEAGNADAALVYKTDALISKKVKIAFEIPADAAPKITYPVAVLKDAPHAAAARKFVDYLASPPARDVFTRHGFLP
jgi:molybdate transport system substrate-binding protein